MGTYKFEFTDYNVDVEINGHTFKMDCSSEIGDYLKKSASEIREIAEAINSGEKTAADALAFGMEILDTLLGDGAAEKCFEGRKKRTSDIADMCVWLADVSAAFRVKREKAYAGRAKRRAALKSSNA